jgi:mRNA-degrading endonuclease RelE of RelBE toxin-antitoxin system
VTYRVSFGPGAATQYHSLPKEARDALVERAAELATRPWDDTRVRPPGSDSRFREAVFGEGHGVLGFYVDDDKEHIRIFDILWAG